MIDYNFGAYDDDDDAACADDDLCNSWNKAGHVEDVFQDWSHLCLTFNFDHLGAKRFVCNKTFHNFGAKEITKWKGFLVKYFRDDHHVIEVVVDLDVEAGPIDDLRFRQLQLGRE